MIIQISRSRIIQVSALIFLTLSLWLTIGLWVSHHVNESPEGKVVVTFNFLAPMKPSSTNDLIITQADTGKKVPFEHQWLTASKLQITITEKSYPLGRKYRYHFSSAPAMIWPFHVWSSSEFQGKVKLRFMGIKSNNTVPSRGPIILQFNTNVDPQKIANYVSGPVPGKLIPANTKSCEKDYSCWEFWPDKKLNNLYRYTMNIKAGLPDQYGGKLSQTIEAKFLTTPEFLIEKAFPEPGSKSIWLTREIILQTNQQLKSAKLDIQDLPGRSIIKDKTIRYLPERVMMPGTTYKVKARLTSTSNETLDFSCSFSTTNLGKNRWLELKLEPSPELWLMEGCKTLKKFNVRVRSDRNMPQGTLYEANRQSDLSSRTPWMRLNADILLHPLPENMQDNHEQLGFPKSYSCVYLQDQDAKELFNTLPQGFMLICH
ncbi:hypothetical protein JCM14036_20070 [Desulfotomaculum defluvii]